MIKANVISENLNWKKIIKKPNNYLKKNLKYYPKHLYLKKKIMNSQYS